MGYAISPKELKARLDKGDKLVLLDVREEWEYSLAKLDGSILIPLGTIPQSLAQLNRDSEIIAICHHGMRSADATNFLLQQGFPNVKNLVGGIDAWSDPGGWNRSSILTHPRQESSCICFPLPTLQSRFYLIRSRK